MGIISSVSSNTQSLIKDTLSSAKQIGNLKDKAGKEFFYDMENQLLNQFKIIIMPHMNVLKNLVIDPLSVTNLITIAENPTIGKFYIQSITTPTPTYTYTRMGNKQYVTDVEYPDNVNITFLDNDLSTVQRYLSHWQDEVHQMNSLSLLNAVSSAKSMVKGLMGSIDADAALQQKFKSDPGLAKKTAYILPLKRNGNPAIMWYMLEGLSIKNIEDIEWNQSEGEPLKLTASFAVDNVRSIKPF